MKVTCDREGNALYIRLFEGEHECHTLRLTDEIKIKHRRRRNPGRH
jgi:uncharacterized protein YuzE